MIAAVERYLELRRAAGFDLSNSRYLLASYARFAAERHQVHVRAETAIAWAAQGPSVAQRHERLNTVCRFARFAQLEDERHEVPPARYFGYRKRRRLPHIYTQKEIERLIKAAHRLRPTATMRPRTYAALLSLLFATGLRISEALRLRFDDITADGLLIRETKFRKTRLVPLHDSAIAGLRQYLLARRLTGAADDHIFVDNDGRPLRYVNVQSTFLTLLKWADLWPTSGHHRRPRLHDARHTFAVKALQACPAGRARIGKHMVALATYLGHVNIYATYWYLDAAPELLADIASVSESFTYGGAQS
jgi:integrase/recombinase XerD